MVQKQSRSCSEAKLSRSKHVQDMRLVAAIRALCTAAVLSAVDGTGAGESSNATRVVVIGAGASVSSEWAEA